MSCLTIAVIGGDSLLCRLCLRKPQQAYSWSHLDQQFRIASMNKSITLRTIINTFRSTAMYEDKLLPQNVCNVCVNSAIHSLLFWHQCQDSEQRWEQATNDLYKKTVQLDNKLNFGCVDRCAYVLENESINEIYNQNRTVTSSTVCSYLNQNDIKEVKADLTHNFDSEFVTKKKQQSKTCNKSNEPSKISYTCTHCLKNFVQKKYLTTHLRQKHNIESNVECNHCNRKFKSISNLQRHICSREIVKVFNCSLCEQVFNLASEFELHITEKHKQFPDTHVSEMKAEKGQVTVIDRENINICKHCGKKYYSLVRLRKHEEKHNSVICEKCGQNFPYPYKLKMHNMKCPNNADSQCNVIEKDSKNECKMCNRIFTSFARLNSHLSKHMGVVCEKCGYHFKYSSQLKAHKKQCQKDRRPGNPKALTEVPKDRQYICDYCGKEFHVKESLKAHIKSQHLYPKIFKCSHCSKTFSYKGGLKAHAVVHTRERSQQCDICGGYFVTKPALVYHMRLHTGERPFACQLCDETFLSASRRMAHVRKKHWGRTEECRICASKFFTPYAVRKHMSRHFNPNSKLFCSKSIEGPAEYNVL